MGIPACPACALIWCWQSVLPHFWQRMQLALREHIRTNTSDLRNHLERMEFGDVWSHDVCLKCSLDQMRPLPTPIYANVTFKILATHIAKQLVAPGPLFYFHDFVALPKTLQTRSWVCGSKRSRRSRLLGTSEAAWYRMVHVSCSIMVSIGIPVSQW